MKPISDQQIVTRLKLENPWWETGAIPAEQAGMKERPYLDQAYGLMTDFTLRRALVLMGPRRVGKTVMLFHAIARLIKSGVPAKRIFYVSVDHPLYNHLTLDDFVAKFKEIASLGPDGGQAYAFFRRDPVHEGLGDIAEAPGGRRSQHQVRRVRLGGRGVAAEKQRVRRRAFH